jgi:hypothetical protein
MTETQNIPESQSSSTPTEKKQSRCCLWGCLGIVGILVISGICLVSAPLLLRAIGLFNPPAEVVYGAAPDRYASAQVEDILRQSSIEGIKVYVIPERGSDAQTAFVIVDPSSGFDGFGDLNQNATEAQVDERMDDVLRDLAARNQAENLRIKRVAIDYRDENGETFLTMTTTMAEIEDYMAGLISRDEFYGQFGVGFGDLINQFLEEINE